MSTAEPQQSPGALRAEHDDLARRLEIRRSVDHARRGFLRVFGGLISTGLAVRLAWDRWGPLKPGVARKLFSGPPMFLWLAGAVALLLLSLGIASLLRARRLAREEDALFARLRALRAQLGIDG